MWSFASVELKSDPGACCAGNVFAIEHLPARWLVRRGPVLPLNEVGLCPYLTIDGVGSEDGHLNSAFGRNSAPRIHNVRVTVSGDAE